MKFVNLDGWANLFTGIGMKKHDKRKGRIWSKELKLLSQDELRTMYRGEGLATRIVNLPANEMLRAWFKVEGDKDGLISQKLDVLSAKKKLSTALKWDRLFGGSLIIAGLDDGGGLEEPLNEDNISDIKFLHVFDRYSVTTFSVYDDPENEKYGETEVYMVTPKRGGTTFNVHESRCLVFDGMEIDDLSRRENDGWGDSVLQRVFTRLKGLSFGYENLESIIEEFIIGTLSIKDLASTLVTNGEKDIQKRLAQIDMSKSLISSILLDADGEKYERISSTVSGLGDLFDRLINALSAVSEIPVTLLMGQSPAGLKATGDSDIRFFYDSISSKQETKLQEPLERLVKWIQLCKDYEFRGKELDSWKIQFNPLWMPTSKEQAETRKTVAEADKIYVELGVVDETEIRVSRFSGEYKIDTVLDEKLTNSMKDNGEE